jgi:hypothetical protein
MSEPCEPFGPDYPRELGAAVARFRTAARRGGVKSKAEKHAYGDAVGNAILALQRRELMACLKPANPKINCASGTVYNTGAEIHAALRRQQRNALANYPSAVRRARTPEQWRKMYADAMKQKRARLALQAAA